MNDLRRFLDAQDGGMYQSALEELRAGYKRSHWIWFIFPQVAGLGRSHTARFFGISDRDEALAFAHHSVLGPRLAECTGEMLAWAGERSPAELLGPLDALKFKSSMTLFEAVSLGKGHFTVALDALCAGARDRATLERL